MTRRARVAWWSPLPPLGTGVADYSYDLLEGLRTDFDLVAVVDDRTVGLVRAPDGVPIVGASKYLAGVNGQCDLDVYQMGNSFFHAYMHSAALDRPGILILHDPALVDLYRVSCGSSTTPSFVEEARFNDPSIDGELPVIHVDGQAVLDRLQLLMSRRLIETNVVTAVHSRWAQETLQRRFPGARYELIPSFARVIPINTPIARDAHRVVFGVYGGLSPHKRILSVVRAFGELNRQLPGQAELDIVGRLDVAPVFDALTRLIQELGIGTSVHVSTEVSLENFEASIANCDVVIALRWPTAGETSAVIMRAFGAGKPVITSDVPQHGELDSAFCWRVSTDPDREIHDTVRFMRSACENHAQLRDAGVAAQQFIAEEASLGTAIGRYVELIQEHVTPTTPPDNETPHSLSVTAIADWNAATGLAEAARRSVDAIAAAGVTLKLRKFEIRDAPRSRDRGPSSFTRRGRGNLGNIDLWYLNVNELHLVPESVLHPIGVSRYVVGHWAWELPTLAELLHDQVDRVDEIWVGSGYTANAFRGHTGKPVRVIPLVVEPRPDPNITRCDFGIPRRAYTYLFSFDANSSFARKNPWSIIRAFRRAFSPWQWGVSSHLVLKVMNLSRYPEAEAEIRHGVDDVRGTLLVEDLTNREMAALISLCDAYVSLHRSEGFGLGMAEAMALGRPVIATAFSGNMDYMSPVNSCLVGFQLRPIEARDHVHHPGAAVLYEPGQLWAEPDVTQAARWMRKLHDDPALRRRIGTAAATTMRRRHSRQAVGATIARRLRVIEREIVGRGAGADMCDEPRALDGFTVSP